MPGPVEDSADIAEDERWQSFAFQSTMLAPWFRWLDPAKFDAHVDTIQKLGVEAIASCHGPGFRGALVEEAFRQMRTVPSMPAPHEPDQHDLEAILAEALSAAAV